MRQLYNEFDSLNVRFCVCVCVFSKYFKKVILSHAHKKDEFIYLWWIFGKLRHWFVSTDRSSMTPDSGQINAACVSWLLFEQASSTRWA